jgi:hypothetical protein
MMIFFDIQKVPVEISILIFQLFFLILSSLELAELLLVIFGIFLCFLFLLNGLLYFWYLLQKVLNNLF